MVYFFNGPQLEFVGAKLESVIIEGNQFFNIGGGVHGVRENPYELYSNDTMQYLLGRGLGKLLSRHIIHGVRPVEGS